MLIVYNKSSFSPESGGHLNAHAQIILVSEFLHSVLVRFICILCTPHKICFLLIASSHDRAYNKRGSFVSTAPGSETLCRTCFPFLTKRSAHFCTRAAHSGKFSTLLYSNCYINQTRTKHLDTSACASKKTSACALPVLVFSSFSKARGVDGVRAGKG